MQHIVNDVKLILVVPHGAFLSLHIYVLVLRCRVVSFTAIELRACGTGLYWFSNMAPITRNIVYGTISETKHTFTF